MSMQIKPSEKNQDFATGAVRGDNTDRGKPSLFPFDVFRCVAAAFGGAAYFPYAGLDEVCKVFEAGARKYAARNWEKGIPLENYVDSATRHLGKFVRGFTDEPHAGQFAWNAVCLMQTHLWIVEGRIPQSLNTLPLVNTTPDAELQDVELPVVIETGETPLSYYIDESMKGLQLYLRGRDPYLTLRYFAANSLAVVDTYIRLAGGELDQGLNDLPRVNTTSVDAVLPAGSWTRETKKA